jgi:hypothetical protein
MPAPQRKSSLPQLRQAGNFKMPHRAAAAGTLAREAAEAAKTAEEARKAARWRRSKLDATHHAGGQQYAGGGRLYIAPSREGRAEAGIGVIF